MAKQTFTTGSVLTATQMNNLQANDYNWELNGQTASYVLVAADAGKRVQMNAAGSTTITVNTGLFTAGDTVIIQNIGAGTCTVTAGTATVNKATNASLALAQYQGGTLYFVSASSAIFFPFDVGSTASGGYTLISTTTLSGATTTLSAIPGTYRDLVLIIKQITNASSYVPRFTINNNTTDNYHWSKGSFGTGSASWGTDYNVTTGWDLTNQGTNQDGAASTNYHRIFLPDYANTTSPKIMQSQSYGISTLGGSPYSNFVVGYFATTTAPTAAITSIEIKVSAGSATGGTALLYGVS